MPVITEVRFAHEDGAIVDMLTDHPHLDVRVVRETSTAPERSVYYLQFDHDDAAAIRESLEHDHTVAAAEPMLGFEDRQQLWAIEFTPSATLLAPEVTDAGGLVVDARSSRPIDGIRGWHERWLLPDREAIHRVWQHAREQGFAFRLLEFHRGQQADAGYRGLDAMTEEQRRTIAVAYERGYFSEPRETSLEELGETLGVSASAVSGRLKRGMKALIGGTLAVEGLPE